MLENVKETSKGLVKDPQVVRVAATAVGAVVGGALVFFGVKSLMSEPNGLIEEVINEAAEAVASK